MIRVVLGFFSLVFSAAVFAGPIVKIESLSPKYNSEIMHITWNSAVVGPCANSDFAVSNATAANHDNLVAVLLMAMAADSSVELTFGGGCSSENSNWIQTVKVLK